MALIFKRCLHTSPALCGPNPLFHLQALSNARETARAAQLSKLPRTAHSPQLQLLQAEASLTPLASEASNKASKDPKTAVNIAKAASPKPPTPAASLPPSPPPVKSSASVARDSQLSPDVVKELKSIRQELGEWQASVDDRLALIAYDLKRVNGNSGSIGWLAVFGAAFLFFSWGLVRFAAEKKAEQARAAEAVSQSPKRQRSRSAQADSDAWTQAVSKSVEYVPKAVQPVSAAPTKPPKKAQPKPEPEPEVKPQPGRSTGWFW